MTGDLSPVPHGRKKIFALIALGVFLAIAIVGSLDYETESLFAMEQATNAAVVRAAQLVAEAR